MDIVGEGAISILHVDDEPAVAELTADYLEREGRFDVEIATDAGEALDRLSEDEVDCIVSDYDMPGMDGIELLEAVREEYGDLPFVLFTGKGSEEIASEAVSAGATDYLQKGTGTEQYDLLANRIENAVQQYRATRRAVTLDRIRTLVADVNQALVRASSREELEADVCEIVHEADPYRFAWIGELDPDTDRVVPRTSAGIEDEYLEEIVVTADESPTGRGPGGRAIRKRRVTVTQDVEADPTFDPWREEALDRGFRAVAAVPLAYEETVYGLLAVYADRTHAFDDEERELLAELGDDVAHAIASLETRAELERSERRYRTLAENFPNGAVLLFDTDLRYRIAHGKGLEEIGTDPEEYVGKRVDEVFEGETADRLVELYRRALDGESVSREMEYAGRTYMMEIVPVREDGDVRAGMVITQDITERRRRERRIEALNDAMRSLLEAETRDEVAEVGVEAARDILGLEANAIHLYDEDVDGLVPAAITDAAEELVDEPPTFTEGDSIAWRVYERGGAIAIDDVREDPDVHDPETPVRSELHLPLGDYGILIAGSDTPAAFDRGDVTLGEVLSANVVAALDQLERERRLRARERELRRQNERLEEFASIVSHDLRSPLNVATGRIEMAKAECESDHLDAVERALDRMDGLVTDLLTLAREEGSEVETEPIPLAELAGDCWEHVETPNARLVVETGRIVRADEGRLRRLLSNLFRNSVEHGASGESPIAVTVGDLEGGFYVEDDGPGIPTEEHDRIFEEGYSTAEDGTGFGLSIVESIVDAHDWEIGVTTAGDDGGSLGARFEITDVEFEEE